MDVIVSIGGGSGGFPQMARAEGQGHVPAGASFSGCRRIKMLLFCVVRLPKRCSLSLQYCKSAGNSRLGLEKSKRCWIEYLIFF